MSFQMALLHVQQVRQSYMYHAFLKKGPWKMHLTLGSDWRVGRHSIVGPLSQEHDTICMYVIVY